MSKKEHTGLLGARLASADKFPEIDFSNLISSHDEIRANELKNLSDACTDFGFFFLAHSPISNDILQTVYREANRFHDLEDGEQKRAVHASHSPLGRGWWPLNEEPAYEPGTISYLESFDLGPDLPTLNETARTGPNLWPELPGFRDNVQAAFGAFERTADGLFDAFARMLHLPPDRFSRYRTEQSRSTMRMIHYPANNAPMDEINVGISAHTDFECFTLMHQTATGLQVRDRAGNWIQVPVRFDQLFVIPDDALEIWTNGLLSATSHRVPNTPWERNSLIMFCAVDGKTVLKPLSEFVSATRPSRYEPVTQGDQIDRKMQQALENLDRMKATGRYDELASKGR